jgi:hypothetical protein
MFAIFGAMRSPSSPLPGDLIGSPPDAEAFIATLERAHACK